MGRYISEVASGGGTVIQARMTSAGVGQDVFGAGKVRRFTATGEFSVPGGVDKVRVTILGGGGSGAKTDVNTGTAVSGGGHGGYASAILDVVPLSLIPVTVGLGGLCPTANGNGASGGSSSFGSLLTCTGGGGGVRKTDGTLAPGGAGGTNTKDSFVTGAGGSAQAVTNSYGAYAGGGGLGGRGGNALVTGPAIYAVTGGGGVVGRGGDATATNNHTFTCGGGSGFSAGDRTDSGSSADATTVGRNIASGTGENATIYAFTPRHEFDSAFRGSGGGVGTSGGDGGTGSGGGAATSSAGGIPGTGGGCGGGLGLPTTIPAFGVYGGGGGAFTTALAGMRAPGGIVIVEW